ncbi:sodium- and chloride-dependent neutral and basic amino acid transporter B(0+)-like [Grus japonensis]|uniref:Sodium- and chloride-dependent neutral and basic amino acid transporter B(0+)-like n=1 Tax=Grus japonensis TaxID=30415 RepID=A0ABC9YIG1_GRUJA
MVTTQQKAVSSTSPELLAPGRSNVATQTELLTEHVTTQTSDCRVYVRIFLEMERDSKHACGRCDQVDVLLCLMSELQEEMGKLRSIRQSEKEIDQWSCALPSLVQTSQLSMATIENRYEALGMVDKAHDEIDEEYLCQYSREGQSPLQQDLH